ncbi:aminopeptidase N [Alcanivorax sp. 1008]|uniref:aminopeptidase N n=1 Tax=Alcanivorax sp. 1008 TaxID=2816853 RepID=UPI001E02E4D1|nr:aminopeptidase N [Alcanivorax sp. 1008]MCC1497176.1 aminopeptidase N [Alcanivorax sp. 1008]
MRDNQAPKPIRRLDYRPPAFWVDSVALDFDIYGDLTRVRSRLCLRRNTAADAPADCVFDGEMLVIESLAVDGKTLSEQEYRYQGGQLALLSVPDKFVFESVVTIDPRSNTALEGLYVSKGMYCTQCEAEGFRRITFFPDRPDVLSRFTTTVRADKSRYPLLLSNGNPVAEGEEDGRHWVTWEDPFAKPCYLFALVAGDLACLEDTFTTTSGRSVKLRIYAEHHDLDKLDFAMDSLKRSMLWDEQVYGREYDLDIYMIVAVSHFNMGAMENKGLNIFNTSCVLAHPDTTTDQGYQRVEAVVAHEYFHNWSGNRVTCRDWFQLSLKEGFTVFRDQEFSADTHSRAVKRVEDVDMLRTIQFAEDGGPMAHPVRPDEYQKIDNFYTVTIYEKGAEVVRMQYNLLGPELFRKATDLYFSRFDGQAVTCDDFVDCMEEASGQDLSQFRRWYSQAGTPRLTATDQYSNGIYRLTLSQQTAPTPGQADKQPLMVPVSMALLDQSGQPLVLDADGATETVLILSDATQTFEFTLPEQPVPVLLRGFSAPVELRYPYSADQLALILAHDTDGYCRWDAAQRLGLEAIRRIIAGSDPLVEAEQLLSPWRQVLARAAEDPAGAALLLGLPSERALAEQFLPLDPRAIHLARTSLERALGRLLQADIEALLPTLVVSGPYRAEAADIGRRTLMQRCLALLASGEAAGLGSRLAQQFGSASNMTERLGALRLLVWHGLPQADQALKEFAARYAGEALVMDQWFAVQALVPGEQTVAVVERLMGHSAFEMTSPNRVRGLLGSFANGNPSAFHAADGSGYRLYADALARLDRLNPQVAARMANAFATLPRLAGDFQVNMRLAVQQLRDGECSANLAEVLDRLLQ